jgi:hypothetical protein
MANETQNTQVKLPSTPEELQEYMDKAKEEAYQRGAKEATQQSQKMIATLEAKVALSENNPLSFPRLTNDEGEAMELPMIHPFSVNDNGKNTIYNPEDFVSDDIAQKKFGKTAKKVLRSLYDFDPDMFVKIK